MTSPKRWQGAPDIPAIGESLPGFDVRGWYGLLAPAGTPRDIIQRINTETARAIKEPDARERLYSIGSEPLANTPEEFAASEGMVDAAPPTVRPAADDEGTVEGKKPNIFQRIFGGNKKKEQKPSSRRP